jgi:hypothetical protein
VASEVQQAVQFQIEQFADAQPVARSSSRPVRTSVSSRFAMAVDVWGQRSRQRVGGAWDVGVKQQPPRRRRRPTPAGDVFKKATQIDHVLMKHDYPDGAALAVLAAPRPGPGPWPQAEGAIFWSTALKLLPL